MSEERTNGLSLIANNSDHISFNADVAFSIEEREGVPSVHLADVVYTLVLDALKKQAGGAHLFPGEHRLVITGCATNTGPLQAGEEDVSATDEADGEESAPQTLGPETDAEAEESAEEEATNEEEAV